MLRFRQWRVLCMWGPSRKKPCRECAIHSQPALVDNNWYGAVAASTVSSASFVPCCPGGFGCPSPCPSTVAGVAAPLTSLAITVQLVQGQGFWGAGGLHWRAWRGFAWRPEVGSLSTLSCAIWTWKWWSMVFPSMEGASSRSTRRSETLQTGLALEVGSHSGMCRCQGGRRVAS